MVTRYDGMRPEGGTARKAKQSGTGKSSSSAARIHWVNITLSSEQKSSLAATELDVEKWWDTLTSLVESGHKLVINPKNDRGFVGVSCIGVGDECPNKDFGLSGEGGSFDKAVRSLWFKMDLLDYQWASGDDPANDDFR